MITEQQHALCNVTCSNFACSKSSNVGQNRSHYSEQALSQVDTMHVAMVVIKRVQCYTPSVLAVHS